jgi:hypothetical protein
MLSPNRSDTSIDQHFLSLVEQEPQLPEVKTPLPADNMSSSI